MHRMVVVFIFLFSGSLYLFQELLWRLRDLMSTLLLDCGGDGLSKCMY